MPLMTKHTLDCRRVFEQHNHVEMLGRVFGALADLEDDLGHYDRAVEAEHNALRYAGFINVILPLPITGSFVVLSTRSWATVPALWSTFRACGSASRPMAKHTVESRREPQEKYPCNTLQ